MTALIPTWVFALLALLLWLGWVQSRARQVRPIVTGTVALGLATYSLWGVLAAFGLGLRPALAWVAGAAAALLLARLLLSSAGMAYLPSTRRVHVPGSWLPLALMLGIFGIKFGLGVAGGTGHPVLPGSAVADACALMLGLMSGLFAARARAVVTVARGA